MRILDCIQCGSAFVSRNTRLRCNDCITAKPSTVTDRRRRTSDRYKRRKREATVERFKPVEIFERDGWRCGICGHQIDQDLRYPDPGSASLDHVVPLADGGLHSRANSQASHLGCNCRKRDRSLGPEQLRLV